MKTPIGFSGLSSLAREVWIRLAIISSACRWPMTRWLSVSASVSTASISFFTMRPTGTPVQSWTTEATAGFVDARQDQRRVALERGEPRLQIAQFGEQG